MGRKSHTWAPLTLFIFHFFLKHPCSLSVPIISTVEELYCKRPIQCLAFSEMLTPHPLTARRVCTGAGGGHTRWVMRGWGSIVSRGSIVNSSEDARHCKYFVFSTYTKDIYLFNLNFRHFHKMCSVNMLRFLFSPNNYTYFLYKKHFKFYL
jgi:hypothetical protein